MVDHPDKIGVEMPSGRNKKSVKNKKQLNNHKKFH
jgi:hypothetical protein